VLTRQSHGRLSQPPHRERQQYGQRHDEHDRDSRRDIRRRTTDRARDEVVCGLQQRQVPHRVERPVER
jgi:hypothetical protein